MLVGILLVLEHTYEHEYLDCGNDHCKTVTKTMDKSFCEPFVSGEPNETRLLSQRCAKRLKRESTVRDAIVRKRREGALTNLSQASPKIAGQAIKRINLL